MNKNKSKEFIEYANKYLESHNNHYSKQLEIIDVNIKANDPQFKIILSDILNKKIHNKQSRIKPLLKNLLYNNQEEIAIETIDYIRTNYNDDESYYSLELALYYTLEFNYNKSIDEYILF